MWVLFIQNIHNTKHLFIFSDPLAEQFFQFHNFYDFNFSIISQGFRRTINWVQVCIFGSLVPDSLGTWAVCWLVAGAGGVGIIDNNNKEPGLFQEGQASSDKLND